jgi:hypothetical protein
VPEVGDFRQEIAAQINTAEEIIRGKYRQKGDHRFSMR